MSLDHLYLHRILLPALIRHVREDLIEDQVMFVLLVNRGSSERRQQRTLRLRVIEAKRIDEEMDSVAQIIKRLFRKTGDQCDGRLDTVPVSTFNPLPGLR